MVFLWFSYDEPLVIGGKPSSYWGLPDISRSVHQHEAAQLRSHHLQGPTTNDHGISAGEMVSYHDFTNENWWNIGI